MSEKKINGAIVTDNQFIANQFIANQFNHLYVSIGPNLTCDIPCDVNL